MHLYKKKYKSSTIWGKLCVYSYLTASKKLKTLVPHTVPLTPKNLKLMVDKKYNALYIKPNIGSQGIDVCKLKHSEKGYELFSMENKKQHRKHFKDLSSVYKRLKARYKQRMIVQKGVDLDKINSRPYDIRAMVQRKPGGSWTCTGFMVKVGRENKIVTNYYQGGEIYSLDKLLKIKGFSPSKTRFRIQSLSRTAVEIARTLSKKRSGMQEIGVDFAYDSKMRLWIIEVNSNHPQFHPMKKLEPAAYHRMVAFAQSYGRRDD